MSRFINDDLADLYKRFIVYHEAQGSSPWTLKFYRANVSKFLWWCAQQSPPITKFSELNPDNITEFVLYLDQTKSGRYGSTHPHAQSRSHGRLL